MFLLALWHVRSKPGRRVAAIRQSEPAALAPGATSRSTSCGAVALASFMTGVAGALLAAQVTTSTPPVPHEPTRSPVAVV